MDAIKALVENKSKFTHYIAVGAALLFAAYFQLPAFHDYVFNLYGYLPQWAKELISTGVALYMWYRNGHQDPPPPPSQPPAESQPKENQ